MINVTQAFRDEVFVRDNRSYIYNIRITFQDETYIDVTNENLMEQGGVVIDEAVSTDEDIGLGSCVVNKLSFSLKNFDGEYDSYDFRKANVVLKIGLNVNGQVEQFQRGIYIVAEPPVYNSSAVTITCYDYMMLMDKLYSEANISYPVNISTLLNNLCTACGVQRVPQTLATDSMTFTESPATDTTTCREILSHIAQMNGMFCRFDELGRLYFEWFANGFLDSEIVVRQVQDGAVRTVQDNVVRISYMNNDGGVDWNNQVPIPAIYNMDMAKYDTVITGVRIVIQQNVADDTSTDPTSAIDTYVSGTDDYLISVENNPLVNASNAETILAILASRLIGLRYRKATVSHLGMPWLCAGDTALVTDAKGLERDILVSSTVFTALDKQNTTSAGASPVTNTAASFTPETIQYVKTMEGIKPVIQTLNQRIANANGLYETRVTQSGATITYLHNKPNLSESDIQMMISDVGVLVTANGTAASPTWYGLTVDGNLIANILQANGINADWINTGALVIYDDDNNEIFRADKTNKIFRWSMDRSEMTGDGDMYLYDDGSVAEWSSFHVQSLDVDSPWREVLWDTTVRSTGIGTEDRTAGTSGSLGATSIYLGGGSYGQILDISPSASLPDTASITNCVINNKDLEDWIQQFSQQYAFKSYTTIASGANLNAAAYAKPGNYVCMSGTVAATLTNAPFTNSSFQLVVWQFTSSNQRMQIAWQNAVESYIRYRIRTDGGTWGSWHSLARQDVVGTIVYKTLSADYSLAAGSTYHNLVSISCPAGVWLVNGHVNFNNSSGAPGTYKNVAIGTTATNNTYGFVQQPTTQTGNTCMMTSRIITLSSTTTLYLNVFSAVACNVTTSHTLIEAVRLR